MRVGRFTFGVGLVCVLVSPACGGIGAGEYVVYSIASQQASFTEGCDDDDEGSNTFLESGEFVLYVAGGETDTPLLDLGGAVLAGSEVDDGYDFAGERVDRQEFGGETFFDSDHDGVEDNEDPAIDADADGLDDGFDDAEVDVDGDLLDDRFEDDIVDQDNDGIDDRLVSLGGDTLITTTSLAVHLVIDGNSVNGTTRSTATVACDGACAGFEGSSCTATSNFVGIELEDATLGVPNG